MDKYSFDEKKNWLFEQFLNVFWKKPRLKQAFLGLNLKKGKKWLAFWYHISKRWHLDQNENMKNKNLYMFIHTKEAEDNSKLMMIVLGGHIRPMQYLIWKVFFSCTNFFSDCWFNLLVFEIALHDEFIILCVYTSPIIKTIIYIIGYLKYELLKPLFVSIILLCLLFTM